jgi:hypothetical protein
LDLDTLVKTHGHDLGVIDSHHSLRPVRYPALFDDHGHNGIFVGLSPLLVRADHLVYANVADQIARDKDEVAGDDPVRVNVAQSISWRKRLLRRHDGHDFEASRWM